MLKRDIVSSYVYELPESFVCMLFRYIRIYMRTIVDPGGLPKTEVYTWGDKGNGVCGHGDTHGKSWPRCWRNCSVGRCVYWCFTGLLG